MSWQGILKGKDGRIRADLGKGGSGEPPKKGDIIDYPIDGEVIKARVTGVSAATPDLYNVNLEEL